MPALASPLSLVSTTTPFILASKSETLIGRGSLNALACRRTEDLVRCVSTFFEGARRFAHAPDSQLLVGALPFSPTGRVHLFQPRSVDRMSGRTNLFEHASQDAALPTTWSVRAEPSRSSYARRVREALDRMESSDLKKVVLGRRLTLEANKPISIETALERLSADAESTTYAIPLPPGPDGEARTMVGASPELLIERRGLLVRSEPMAGSTPRRSNPDADRQAAQALLTSDKDRREHAAVVDWVVDRLAPYCRRVHAADAPALKSTATMWHLVTPVSGELRDARTSSLELSLALHPTPAVCGVPEDAALAAITDLESFDRGFFAGAVGWCDHTGDGQWFVTIRCGEISGHRADLYAGAGIVVGSDPESEAAETSAKFTTLLKALGVDEDGHVIDV